MSAAAVTTVAPSGPAAAGGGRLRWAVADVVTVTWRNVLNVMRVPESLFFSAVQPVMFVLLFRYVFGGVIHIPGISYVNYLMPGIFVQSVAFGAVSTAIGLAEDLQKGLIERFRALPMNRGAVLAGRTAADLLRNVAVVIELTLVGLAVGFRPDPNALAYLAGVLILLLFSYSIGWGFACIGLSAPTSEAAQLMSFPILFPFTFASGAFVPVSSMPGWLQAFAANQPVTKVAEAARALMLGLPAGNSVWEALAWCLGMLVVFSLLATWRFRRTV